MEGSPQQQLILLPDALIWSWGSSSPLERVDRSQLVEHCRALEFTAVGLDPEGLVSSKLNRALPSSHGPL